MGKLQQMSPEIALLKWYCDMGVDEVISDSPADWFAHSANPPAPARQKPLQTQATPPARPSADTAVMDARERARTAKSLDELYETLVGFDGCGLKKTAKNLCFADGTPEGPLMFIGEAPGRDEDIQGKPFVGRAGQLLDRMLASIGFDREHHAYITNIVYWRPPGNRTPTPQESQLCRPFLERQIELVDPDVIVLLGGAAAKQMLNTTTGIMRLRGKWKSYAGVAQEYRTMATLHPAYLLRNPVAKRLAWRDLIAIKQALKNKT